jgi:diacylglycerol kinase (ATP)
VRARAREGPPNRKLGAAFEARLLPPAAVRTLIVRNPGSGSAHAAEALLEAVAARDDLTLVESRSPQEMGRAVREAAAAGFDVVAAAGGDGTVHAAANALMAVDAPPAERPALAVLPFGTGNDLARTLAVPLDPTEALALIGYGQRRFLDLIHICPTEGGACYAINVAAGGFTADMRERLHSGLKKRWGPLAYVIAGLETLPNATVYNVRLRRDGGLLDRMALHSLVVASGRTAGGGQPAAPMANPEDGWLDVVTVREASAGELAALAARAAVGDYVRSELVDTWRVRRLEVEASPAMGFTVDGEMKAETPVTFEVVPHALRVVVGDDYRAEPDYTPPPV